MNDKRVSVAVFAPLQTPLTYRVTPETQLLRRGASVEVPLGKRKVKGVLLGPSTEEIPKDKIKKLGDACEDLPMLPEKYIRWVEWLSKYYVFPIGQVFKHTFPPLKKGGKSRKSSPIPEQTNNIIFKLNEHQKAAFEAITQQPGFSVSLLQGITGSGKTEVYLECIETVLKDKKKALVLVPEISLTPQLIQRFVNRFGDKVGVIHSQLTPREKTNQWWSVVDGEKDILIGVRSAIFCPIEDLGIVVIDEEHETSFKQEEGFSYNAKDAAIMLAKLHDCPIVLGSATPSLETYKNAKEGKYTHLSLPARATESTLPSVSVVDLKVAEDERKEKYPEIPFWLSPELYEKIQTHLETGHQVALFLNRRGEAHSVVCLSCGNTSVCPNCSVALTLHSKTHLICHYCDYHQNLRSHCPECNSEDVKSIGFGTESVERAMSTLFPNKNIYRADRDEIGSREELEEMIHRMDDGSVDILIGTQMIAKGLDFKKLTLVGVLMADLSLNLPDLRSSERTFQLLVQMSGRAGRHNNSGEVVIQTYNPTSPVITHAIEHHFDAFAEWELAQRELLSYPPYGRLAQLRFQGNELSRVKESARIFREILEYMKQEFAAAKDIEVLGPAPCPIAKLRGKHRYQLLIKGPNNSLLSQVCRNLISQLDKLPPGVKTSFDIDPIQML